MKRLSNPLMALAAVAASLAAGTPSVSDPPVGRRADGPEGYQTPRDSKVLRSGNNRRHTYRDDPKEQRKRKQAAASRKRNRK